MSELVCYTALCHTDLPLEGILAWAQLCLMWEQHIRCELAQAQALMYRTELQHTSSA